MRTRHLIILILVCLFQTQFVFSQTNKLYISPTDCPLGKTTQVEMRMDNRSEVVAMQFNLHIPDVVKLESTEGIQLMEERKDDHQISVRDKGNNNYLVVVISGNNKPFKLVSGAVIKIPLVVPGNLEADKEYPFELTNVVLADRSGRNVMTSFDAGKIKIVDANGPDITPKNIRLQSDDFKPGGNVILTWDVENIGGKTTDDGWSEQLYLVDAFGNEYALGNTRYTETLSAKGSVSRKAEYKISDYPGIEGQVKAKVALKAFSDWELPVYGENNEGESQSGLNMPKVLAWSVNATVVQEKGSPEVSCMLGRSGSRQKEETFTLKNGNTERLQVPDQITIPKGESGIYFKMKVLDNTIADRDSFVVVTISGNAYPELKKEIWIEDDEHPYLKMSVEESEVKEGGTVTMTLEREWDIPWPLEVRLRSDHSNRFTGFPSVITIPANQKTVEVKLNVANDDLPGLDDEVVFTASAPGHIFDLTSRRFVKVLDDDIPGIDLILSTTTVSEATQSVAATLKRTGVTTNKVTVHLTDNGDGRISMPASIVLEPGVTEKQFAIKTVDNAMKDGDKEVTIKGAIYVSSCNCSTAGSKAGVFEKKITVLDDDDAKVTSVASKTTLLEGDKGKITISVNEVLSAPLTVGLSCDNKEIQLPSSVTIPAGSRSVDIEITVPENNVSEGNRIATVVVDAGSYGKSTCWLNITDQTLPDAVVTAIQTEDKISVSGSAKVGVTIKNEGAASLLAQTKVSVYLSTGKDLNDSSIALGSLYTQNELAVGESVTLDKNFTFPEKTGGYYLIAVVNEEQTKKELSYINNTSAPFALTLVPLYAVQVSLDKSVIKTGESVMITGKATGSQTAGVPVDLYIVNNGYRKVISVTTDNSGIFQKSFTPESWQMGHFGVGACYPDEGLKEEMAGFDMYGLKKASSGAITWEVFTNEKKTGTIKLSNPGNQALKNVTAKIISQPQNCQIRFSSIATMAANGTADLQYEVTGTAVSPGVDWEQVKVQVSSSEGAVLDLDIYYYCRSYAAQLEVSEPTINTTMTIGVAREYPLTITNTGKGETGEISVVLPNVDWMSLASPAKMPSLKYGESATILLRLVPDKEMEANVAHKGKFAINCANGNGVPVSYRILPVSSENGTLVVDVCDEYTYYTAEQPHVSGAKVRVTIPNTNTVVAEGVTETTGSFTKELPAGYYTLEVTADKHDSYKNTILVDPGKENKTVVNLSFQAITYSWEVVETEVQDEYEIKTDVKYETNVPVPVVVTEMPKYVPADKLVVGESYVFEVKLTNKGLITANSVLLVFPQNMKSLEFELLADDGFDLKAQQSVVIPVKMTRKAFVTKALDAENGVDEFGCYMKPVTVYRYKCGEDYKIKKVAVDTKLMEVCSGNNIFINGVGVNLISDEDLIDYLLWRDKYYLPAIVSATTPFYDIAEQLADVGNFIICDPRMRCLRDLALSAFDCLENIKNPCIKALISCGASALTMAWDKYIDDKEDAIAKTKMGVGCVIGISGCLLDIFVPGTGTAFVTMADVFNGIDGVPGLGCAHSLAASLSSCITAFTSKKTKTMNPAVDDFVEISQKISEMSLAIKNVIVELFGKESLYEYTIEDLQKLHQYFVDSEMGDWDKTNLVLMNLRPQSVSSDDYMFFIQRIKNTCDYYTTGRCDDFENYIKLDVLQESQNVIQDLEDEAIERGYDSFDDMYSQKKKAFVEYFESSNTVCSSIKLEISQTMVITRQAFLGTLTINNTHETEALKNVKLDLSITDEDGLIATNHEFQINTKSVENMTTGTDGSWTLVSQQSGVATIEFIPTKYAAPTEPKEYTFGGTLSYVDPFTGLEVIRDLFPVTLTVNPSPNLEMDYFMQRDILGDDPLTKDVVEPMIPSEFSLLIHNVGAGDATNVRMTTKQPEIIDNEKGLLIDLRIKTSQMNGEPETAVMGESVQNDFGTIEAGKTAYAQWWLTSTLLGHFTDYKVEATHVTSYDNPDLSLLDTVRIHELIRGIRVDESASPKVTGFMVNDIPDAEDFPDMMYLTDGTTAPVFKATDAQLTETSPSHYELIITPSTTGWNYINIPDPTNGRLKLISVNEDTNLDTRKVWQTDRTLRDGKDPKYEYRIHAVDYFGGAVTRAASSAGSFRLVFEERPEVVLTVESITGLPEGDAITTSAVGKVTVKFNKPIENVVDGSMIELYHEGKKVEISNLPVVKQDEQTYVLDLSGFVKQNGLYTLTILTSEIKDAEGFTGEEDKTVSWTQQAGGKVKLTMKAEPAEAGTVSPTSAESDYSSEVKLKATASTGYQFKNWTIEGKEVSTDNPYSHLAVSDQTIIANFTPIPYTIEIKYDAAQGSVSFGTGYYEYNSTLDLIATPNDGYRFIGWFKDGKLISSDELYVYKVVGNATLEARFEALSTDPDNPGGEDPDDPDNPGGEDPDDPTANENMETLVIQVYPTQVTDYVYIGNLPTKSRLVLFDLAGKLVKQIASCEGDVNLFMGDQPSGFYLLHILAGDERKKTVKLIKK